MVIGYQTVNPAHTHKSSIMCSEQVVFIYLEIYTYLKYYVDTDIDIYM